MCLTLRQDILEIKEADVDIQHEIDMLSDERRHVIAQQRMLLLGYVIY
jgi:hypothetical protein